MTGTMREEGVRLAKRVAEIVPCSRADAERYIAGGWVSVDGVVAEDPAVRVTPAQAVLLLPGAEPAEPAPVTLLLNKPAGVDAAGALALLTAATLAAPAAVQPPGQGAPRFLKRHLARLTAVAPLETMASGLLVFSQDWRVTRKLVDDGDRIEHEYVAEVSGAIMDNGLARLNAGGAFPLKASWQSEGRLRFAGKGIEAGRIADLCAGVGLTVTSLRRLRIGRVALSGLPVGQWRYLGEFERF
jgi:23S rRNA pseudouridine2604 synthase